MGRSGSKGKGKGSTSSGGSVSENTNSENRNPSGGGIINAQVMGGSNFPDQPGIGRLRNTPIMNPMGTPPAGTTLGGASTPRAIPPNIVGTPAMYQSYSPAQPRPYPSVMGNPRPAGT